MNAQSPHPQFFADDIVRFDSSSIDKSFEGSYRGPSGTDERGNYVAPGTYAVVWFPTGGLYQCIVPVAELTLVRRSNRR